MEIVVNARVARFALPGIDHRTLAGRANGLDSLEVWRQTLAPGAATPVHSHDCEEVVFVLAGTGTVHEGECTRTFGPDSTLVLQPHVDHQIRNTGAIALELVTALQRPHRARMTSRVDPSRCPGTLGWRRAAARRDTRSRKLHLN